MACIGSDWVRGVGEGVDGSTCDEGEGGHVMVLPASGGGGGGSWFYLRRVTSSSGGAR